jgi:hypothetical protein
MIFFKEIDSIITISSIFQSANMSFISPAVSLGGHRRLHQRRELLHYYPVAGVNGYVPQRIAPTLDGRG